MLCAKREYNFDMIINKCHGFYDLKSNKNIFYKMYCIILVFFIEIEGKSNVFWNK